MANFRFSVPKSYWPILGKQLTVWESECNKHLNSLEKRTISAVPVYSCPECGCLHMSRPELCRACDSSISNAGRWIPRNDPAKEVLRSEGVSTYEPLPLWKDGKFVKHQIKPVVDVMDIFDI